MQEQTNVKKADIDVKYFLNITARLLIICAVTALMLAGVNALTADRIAANLAAEKAAAISAIFPEATNNEAVPEAPAGVEAVYLVFSGESMLGYAAEVAPLGFGGALNLMVGVNADGNLVGIQLISHSETPGLGSRVGEDSFLSQFRGKNIGTVNEGFDAITGSTVSSDAVHAGVKTALGAYDKLFSENDAITGGGAS